MIPIIFGSPAKFLNIKQAQQNKNPPFNQKAFNKNHKIKLTLPWL
jgi:hypothetical protein